MTNIVDSQQFESYVPVFDVMPEKWEDARPPLVEHLKKITNSLNAKTIGFLLDEELLNGEQFIPGVTAPGNNPGQLRSVLRKVINCSPLVIGINVFPHGITFDANFTLIQLYGTATDNVGFTAIPLPNDTDTLSMDAVNINIRVGNAWPIAYAFVNYIQER